MSVPPLPNSISFESAVYEVALSLGPEERREFLDHVYHHAPAARARMEALLGSVGECSAYFVGASEETSSLAAALLAEMPATETSSPLETRLSAEEISSHIGDYRLLSRIGEGGCGVVYEAEQQRPVRRNVALKIIRLGMDTERVIARFEAERQALALMDHPHIARVFDAGATTGGRPYFVMERVAGERITAYCDGARLDVEARIKLVIQVCHAIQYAHQKSVVHRDIKPSNVLVTSYDGEPVPKIIDFGIAKAAGSGAFGSERSRTEVDQLMGTPAYMSPEQVDMSGTDVDTRSDIYSLGVLLYEVLGGRPPFDGDTLEKAGLSRMRKVLMEQEPPVLSRMLAESTPEKLRAIAEARREEPARLISRVRGDLERIIAKAMAKDRNRRYQTANALATDLARFLVHEPVQARRPSRLYLAGKFFRRNRLACLSASAVAASLLIGFGTSTWLYFREHQALAEQQRLRVQAQARANVSQAAVMIADGMITEADALLQRETLESVEPSREAAEVFRSLGNWNAFYGNWDRAVQCYTLLSQANRLDGPAEVVEKCEVLAIAAAYLAIGDFATYERYRREMLDLYLPARNSFQAEHLLQAALLTPAGPEMTGRLRDAAAICERSRAPESGEYYPDWEAFSLALYHHRIGDAEKTLEWGKRSLAFPVSAESRSGAARIASTLCLTAMARQRSGDAAAAQRDLRRARDLIVETGQRGLGNEPSVTGVWYSWVIARLLLKEAETELARHPMERHS